MRTLLRGLFFFVLSVAIGIMNTSAQSRSGAANTKIAGRPSSGSFDPVPSPRSMLLVGGGLLVFGGILRRRLRIKRSTPRYAVSALPPTHDTSFS
jgi:hypothetical protein